MPITSNTISDFKLTTVGGITIPLNSDDSCSRFCCKDAIVASWVVIDQASDCSDNSNVGFISLTSSDGGCTTSCTLQKDTSDHKFCFCPCDDIVESEQYTLQFSRQCSDTSDDFSICLVRFKTTVDAGSDQSILFGATAAIGVGTPNPYTNYAWNCSSDFVSDCHALTTLVRPCKTATYTIIATDSDFPNCWASDAVQITVATPIIAWSDVQKSDGGTNCTFSACLISSDTYTNTFHVTLKNFLTGSDIADFYSDTPFCFTQTVNQPIVPGTTCYTLTATLSDFANCSNAQTTQLFCCTRPPVRLPDDPSTFELLFKVFGFLILFIVLGLTLDNNYL